MKLSTILFLVFVSSVLLFTGCQKNKSTDTRKPVPTPVDPTSQPNELSHAMIITGAKKSGNLPASLNSADVNITVSISSASVTSNNYLFVPFAFSAKSTLDGMYLQVQGASEYWDVPIKLATIADNSAAIVIGLPAFVKAGTFKLLYKIYNSSKSVSAEQSIDVTIGPSESACVGGTPPHVAGQDGVTVKTFDFGDKAGVAEISYYMYEQPDRMDIRYNGKWIKSTGPALLQDGQAPPFKKCSEATANDGFVSYGGVFDIDYDPKISREISIYVSGCLEGGTLWYFDVKCPDNTGPTQNVICGNSTAQDYYDKTDPNYHRYPTEGNSLATVICDTKTSSGCTVQAVFDAMLKQSNFIAPDDDTAPVTDCKVTWVQYLPLPGNPIISKVNYGNYSVTNYTLANYEDEYGIPWTHFLYPGKVTRTIVQQNGKVIVTTQGEGTGSYKKLNQSKWATSFVWNYLVDDSFKKYWDKQQH